MLKSDLIFMTKTGLSQLEEVIESRVTNNYRNKKIPLLESLPYEQYIGKHVSKRSQDPDWTNIIKPTLDHETMQEQQDLHIFTPALYDYMQELK